MKSIAYFLIGLQYLGITPLFAQLTQKVNLELIAIDDVFRKSQTVIPVFSYKQNPIEGIEDFGIKTNKRHVTETFNPVLPKMEMCKDTSYTFFYFGGAENSPIKGYVLGIVGNYSKKDSISYLWIDRNMNLDLNDDGPPLLFYNKPEFYLDIRFANPNNPIANHIVRISRFETSKNTAYKKLVNEHFQKNSGTKEFRGLDYAFREQRINLRSSDIIIGTDSFRLSIKDNNSNGIFNEIETDEIIIDNYGKEEINGISFTIHKKETAFERNGKRYIVTKIDPAGNYIEFIEQQNANLEKQLKTGKKIPAFTVIHANDSLKNTPLRKYRKKPIYIVYWNLDNPPSKEEIEIWKTIHNQYGKKIHLILLNYGDSRGKVHGWKLRNGLYCTVAMSNQEQLNRYYVESLPSRFMTGKRLKLKEISITSQEVLEQLQKKYPSKKAKL